MITITESKKYEDNNGNKILGKFKLKNTKIQFGGRNNIVYFDNVEVYNSTIYLRNNNSILYVEENKFGNIYQFILSENCVAYIGKGFTAGRTSIRVGDGNIFFGRDCMLAQDIYIQNHDGHAIYDIEKKTLINSGKSILIGEHVWIGEGVSIFKGAIIGSGSVIGSKSFVSNKEYPPNSIIAGVPAKVIRNNIFWTRDGLHCFSDDKRKNYIFNETTEFNFLANDMVKRFYELDRSIKSTSDNKERLQILKIFSSD